VENRLQAAGLVDVLGGEASDSRLAAYFVHIAQRFQRLTRNTSLQLVFVGQALLAATALYVVRARSIRSLYAEVVYDTAGAAHVRRADMGGGGGGGWRGEGVWCAVACWRLVAERRFTAVCEPVGLGAPQCLALTGRRSVGATRVPDLRSPTRSSRL
jgi:hypothetical protein